MKDNTNWSVPVLNIIGPVGIGKSTSGNAVSDILIDVYEIRMPS